MKRLGETAIRSVARQDELLDLPDMNALEEQTLEIMKETSPQSLYRLGFEELKDRIFIPSRENIRTAIDQIRRLEEKCPESGRGNLIRKFLISTRTLLEFDEPHPDIGLVADVLSTHLIKDGIEVETYKKLADGLIDALNASLEKFEGRDYPTAIKILTQYQVIGAEEVLDIVEYGTKDKELLSKLEELRERVTAFSKRFSVEGFTDGEFNEVVNILRKEGAVLGREDFYRKALSSGFDYSESPDELEQKALSWINEDLPKFRSATESLARILDCKATPEAVLNKLRAKPGYRPEDALAIILKIRPTVQALAAESIVGINPHYDAIVVETPPYLTPIIPSGAAQEFDSFTKKPSQRFYVTTDRKRAPPSGFADMMNLLVHEEYGHCVHQSNTATRYAADPTLTELLPSLHGGSTSEGLAFQRELEFLNVLERLEKKSGQEKLTDVELNFATMTRQYGGFEEFLREMEFVTLKQRIVRFLRVVGDVRINTGKQDLLSFLDWAEAETGLSARTVYYQIFPAHEGIFPGYATCYAVVGQQIREIQKPIAEDTEKMVKFNAYACSMGYPARSIYEKRLRNYVEQLLSGTVPSVPERHEEELLPQIAEEKRVALPARIGRRHMTRKLVIPIASAARRGLAARRRKPSPSQIPPKSRISRKRARQSVRTPRNRLKVKRKTRQLQHSCRAGTRPNARKQNSRRPSGKKKGKR